jgi:hypothetical protein
MKSASINVRGPITRRSPSSMLSGGRNPTNRSVAPADHGPGGDQPIAA